VETLLEEAVRQFQNKMLSNVFGLKEF
jgi:hypothetical protein